jgi:hypothetical protein
VAVASLVHDASPHQLSSNAYVPSRMAASARRLAFATTPGFGKPIYLHVLTVK